MHELSIAEHIVDIALEHLPADGDGKVKEIALQIGMLSGIEIDALMFAMDVVINGTPLEHATVRIERVHGRARCDLCALEFDIEEYYSSCPSCGGFEHTVLQGEEMRVLSLLVEERKRNDHV